MNIVLIGYRGTGKSVVGRIVAERLGRECLSIDEEIVRRAGMGVPKIVEKEGWPGFRDRETEVARDFASREEVIIDCGGGVIERQGNIAALRTGGTVFWLKAGVDVIVERISDDSQRPALLEGRTFTDEVREVLDRRTPLYRDAADHEIDTENLMPDEVAERVIALSREHPQ